MYRLLALDIDGTLLDGKREMSDATVDAVHHAVGRGVRVTVCTGRSLPSAEEAVRNLPLNAPYVLNNGAMIYDAPVRRARYLRNLPNHLAMDAVRVFRSIGFHPIVYGENALRKLCFQDRSRILNFWSHKQLARLV